MKHYIIIGAGITGLSLGHYLSMHGQKVTILEKNKRVGGISSSFRHNGFSLDMGPHKLYSKIDGIMPFLKELLAEDNLIVRKKNSIYFSGRQFIFPVSISNLLSNISKETALIGLKIGLSAIPVFFIKKKEPANYEEYFIQGFGKQGYKLLFEGYAKKVWGDPKLISIELAQKRIPVESIPKAITQMLTKKGKSQVSADIFYYPKHGIVEVCEKLADRIREKRGKILFNMQVLDIILKEDAAVGIKADSEVLSGDYIISTMHIEELAGMLKAKLGPKSYAVSGKIKYSSLILVYIFLNKEAALNENWIFFPSGDIIFNRISEQKSFSRFTAREDKTVICAEVTVPPLSMIAEYSDAEIIQKVRQDLKKTGIIVDDSEVYDTLVRREKDIYPIYDLNYRNNLYPLITEINNIRNLLTIGRYGLFNYNNMDHCIDMGFTVGDYLLKGKEKSNWNELAERFNNYRIVD